MHPAFSVIFFTVTSGVGYGLFALLVLLHLTGIGGTMTPMQIVITAAIALGLITVGLLSSTFHLANPKNAWRAFSRFRTSWLSREGVSSVLFYPISLLYLYCTWANNGEVVVTVMIFGVLTIIGALTTVFTTGMIYACLKTIRQWNTSLTPANYIILGLMLGSLLLLAIRAAQGLDLAHVAGVALVIIAIALLLKTMYYFWIGNPQGATINTATGFTRAVVRLLDTGHTAGTFLTHEFGYQVSASTVMLLRAMVVVLAFVLPLVFAGLLFSGSHTALAYFAFGLAYAGVLVERWLFFAEARHVVNLYHGMERT